MLRRKPLPAQRTVPVKQVGFRARLFLILLAFALIPTIVLAAAWELTVVRALPLLGRRRHGADRGIGRAGDQCGAGGAAVGRAAGPAGRARRALDEGLLRGRQMEFLMTRRAPAVAGARRARRSAALRHHRVARGGTLEPQSEPAVERVGGMDGARSVAGSRCRTGPPRRERRSSWCCATGCARWPTELDWDGTARWKRSARPRCARSARQVAHELKNPLTPIRFAIARLRRECRPESRRDGGRAGDGDEADGGDGAELRAVRAAARRAARAGGRG